MLTYIRYLSDNITMSKEIIITYITVAIPYIVVIATVVIAIALVRWFIRNDKKSSSDDK